MANRLVFTPKSSYPWFVENPIDFEWIPGFARAQAQKSIRNLHECARSHLGIDEILEVSTKSEDELGMKLSAFNLKVRNGIHNSSLESTYQSSKVFENSIQLVDLVHKDPLTAKTDPRLKTSGELAGFNFEGHSFALVSSPNFYDFLYIRALLESGHQIAVARYEGFTDHAFSGSGKIEKGKSVNCQARSLAIYLGISRGRTADEILTTLFQFAMRENPIEQAKLF